MHEVLNIDLSIDFKALRVLIPLISGLIGFIIYWFTQRSDKIRQRFILRFGSDKGSARLVILSRYLGGFTIGLLPLITYLIFFQNTSLTELGLGFYKNTMPASLLWMIGLFIVIIPFISHTAKKPENLANYPQIRAREWDRKMLIGNLVSWAVYLLGYEMFYRGVLLFPLVDELGLWPAIAINIVMYSATHIPKGFGETIGAIPLSLVLCLISLMTGSIWVAFFVHLAMAWTNTITALKHHPEMSIVKY